MTNNRILPSINASTNLVSTDNKNTGLISRGHAAIRASMNMELDVQDADDLFKKGMHYRWKNEASEDDDKKAYYYLEASAKLNHLEALLEFGLLLLLEYGDSEKGYQLILRSCEWRGIRSQRGGAKGSQSIA